MTAAAEDLAVRAIRSGWSVLVRQETDTGGSPFVTVEARNENHFFTATWHTRQTGTYRLFHCSIGANRHTTRACSLREVREVLS